METSEVIGILSLFGIPASGSDGIRRILARLVAAESLSLGELQTARDIVRRKDGVGDAAYLFLAAMFLSLRGGNTFLRPKKGPALLQAGGYLEESADGVGSGEKFCVEVRQAWDEGEAEAGKLDGDVIVNRPDDVGDRWFFRRNLAAVDAVSSSLAALAAAGDVGAPLSAAELATATGFSGFTLEPEQIQAVETVARKRFTVVTGGPGTGKTTVVCAILRALMARGLDLDEIALAAPTGRAGRRMGEALLKECGNAVGLAPELRRKIEALDGTTIHSLLGGSPPNWKYTAANKLPLKLVVVDESSMVDIHLMKALVDALPSDCRLVLLGDKDQLPSVDAGALLGDIVKDSGAPFVVHLVKSNRFTREFAESADAVNRCDYPAFSASAEELASDNGGWLASFEGDQTANRCFRCPLPEKTGPDLCHERLRDWAEHYGLLKDGALVQLASDPALKTDEALTEEKCSERAGKIFDELDRSRILAVVRHGPFGVEGINDLLLKARFDGKLPSDPLSKAGVPVLVTRNTSARKLFNGDVGVTVRGPSGMVVLFPRGKKEVVCCPVGLLPEHELAYAITVHKSQGSEFGNVMVVLPDDENHPLLNRQLVYTAITRAKKRAVVLGTEKAVEAALDEARNEALERDTGIALQTATAPNPA